MAINVFILANFYIIYLLAGNIADTPFELDSGHKNYSESPHPSHQPHHTEGKRQRELDRERSRNRLCSSRNSAFTPR